MNADVGGNCELTQPGKVVVEHGVTIVGIENLPGTIASTASMLYSNNLTNFVLSLIKDGELVLSMDDDVLVGAPEDSDFHVTGMGGVLVCSGGQIHEKQSRLAEVVN
jgi:NAD(P) transhydrogenase subunit alpha